MAFEDIAPTISGLGITETQVNNYFENIPDPPEPPTPPTITTLKVTAIADAIYVDGIEAHNGIKKLAQEVGLTTSQVKMLIREMQAAKALWENPPEE